MWVYGIKERFRTVEILWDWGEGVVGKRVFTPWFIPNFKECNELKGMCSENY
jgi:hypothetical protein